jgi:two-component system sensor histidine kinase MprB
MNLEPCTVRGVSDRLERAVGNLVNNAAKFSGGEGVVELGLATCGTLTVRDHGPGIPEEDLPHVFDRFYRSAEMRDRPGSGLGLAIVAQVAESHSGSITASNAAARPRRPVHAVRSRAEACLGGRSSAAARWVPTRRPSR